MSDLKAAWDDLHAAVPEGWKLGRPSFHDEADRWQQYAYDPTERADMGKRPREWIAVAPTEVMCVREMARRLRELGEGRWPR